MFKKTFFSLLVSGLSIILLCGSLLNPALADAATPDWGVNDYYTEIQVQNDGSIIVDEHLEVDFSKEKHHGILRNIPLVKEDSTGKIVGKISIKNIKVSGENGDLQFEETNNADEVVLKIGDPEILINEVTVYNIHYEVSNALSPVDKAGQQELYWNAVGTEWSAPIKNASATISLPQKTLKKLESVCFTGKQGSKEKNCTSKAVNGLTFNYAVNSPGLKTGEGFTILAKFPKNISDETVNSIVKKPDQSPTINSSPSTPLQQEISAPNSSYFLKNWFVFSPLLIIVLVLGIWLAIRQK